MSNKKMLYTAATLTAGIAMLTTGCSKSINENTGSSESTQALETAALQESMEETTQQTTVSETTDEYLYVSKTPTAVNAVHAEDAQDSYKQITASFKIESSGSNDYVQNSDTYTITKAGEYTLSGKLSGNIVIDAGDEDEIELIFDGLSIESASAAPIYVKNAADVKISVKEGTYNEINDLRSECETDEEVTGAENAKAAIYSACDLTLKGNGALTVNAGYNNGIASKDDLKIKNLTVKVTAVGNAIKGNDSVVIESGNIIAVSEKGDAIKSENTDVSSKGNQKGSITIQSGNVDIYAAGDGISAAYDAVVEDSVNLNILTGSSSEYSKVSKMSEGGSAKGIKAYNYVRINGGTIVIDSEDDAIHSNAGESLENGEEGAGITLINGGLIYLKSGDDAVHADTDLTVNAGEIIVETSYEGFEAHTITINGGSSFVYAADDGLNASTAYIQGGASININGGYVEVETPQGDTDAVDSNGNYVQTGGYVLVKGGSSQGRMAGSVDVDGTITVSGGAIAALGGICETPVDSCNAYAQSGLSFSAGEYVLEDEEKNVILKFTIDKEYSSGWFCSELLETGSSYSLKKDGAEVISWSQETGTMGEVSGFGGFGGGKGMQFGEGMPDERHFGEDMPEGMQRPGRGF